MLYTFEELLYELEQDQDRRILLVEGPRDISFWRELAPQLGEKNTDIYKISDIKCAAVNGGEKGRLIWCAKKFLGSKIPLRVLFFADADWDRIFNAPCPLNTYLTDGRDLESYGCTKSHFRRMTMVGYNYSRADAEKLFDFLVASIFPLSVLRVVSDKYGWKLPFQRTLDARMSRYLTGSEFSIELDLKRLVSALLNNAGISLARRKDLERDCAKEDIILRKSSAQQILHGKDVLGFLEYFFQTDSKSIEALYFVNMDHQSLRSEASIATTAAWIAQA